MVPDTRELIDQTISNLEALARVLRDEIDEHAHATSQLPPEARYCKEAGLTISVLIPKLQAVRVTQVMRAVSKPRECANCDDF